MPVKPLEMQSMRNQLPISPNGLLQQTIYLRQLFISRISLTQRSKGATDLTHSQIKEMKGGI